MGNTYRNMCFLRYYIIYLCPKWCPPRLGKSYRDYTVCIWIYIYIYYLPWLQGRLIMILRHITHSRAILLIISLHIWKKCTLETILSFPLFLIIVFLFKSCLLNHIFSNVFIMFFQQYFFRCFNHVFSIISFQQSLSNHFLSICVFQQFLLNHCFYNMFTSNYTWILPQRWHKLPGLTAFGVHQQNAVQEVWLFFWGR